MSDNAVCDLWVDWALGFKIPQPEPTGGLPKWKAARGKVVDSLKALEAAIRKEQDPDGDAAVVLLRAIRANLTEEPVTPRQQDALERYLRDDDIIDAAETPNVYGVKVAIRQPLLAALASLRGA